MKRWSLNLKVYFIMSMATLGCLMIGSVGMFQMSKIQEKLEIITWNYNKNLNETYKIRVEYNEQVIQGKNLLIAQSQKDIDRYFESLKEGDKTIIQMIDTMIQTYQDEGNKKDLTQFREHYIKWFSLITRAYHHLQKNEREAAYALGLGELRDVSNKSEEFVDSVLARMMELSSQAAHSATKDYADSFKLVITIIALTIIGGVTTSTIILKVFNKSIDQVVSNLTEGAHQVTSASRQIASSSEELSQATTEQAASLEETAASIEEMTSMVQKNAENAKRAHDLSIDSTESAEKGKIVVTDMIKAIDDISHSNSLIMKQIEESNQKISDIVHVISEIGNKTKVINDIVFQTKLLSFNASVEAARAGEHGKGFAVVAEEVGNLAQMSGNAAKEISSMLESSIQKVESIVSETKQQVGHLIHDGKSRVEVGSKIASQCGHVLEEIVKNITNVAEMSHEISVACDEQYQGVQEITRAMNQLDQVTQSNAATSEESASAAEELSSQAHSLKQTIDVLISVIYGANAKRDAVVETDMPASRRRPATPAMPNVVSIKSVKTIKKSFETPMKKASGGYENGIPSEDDPRFEEV